MPIKAFKNPNLSDDVWHPFMAVLEDTAGMVSQIAIEAQDLAELHLRRLLKDREQLPKINQSFFYSCISAVSDSGETVKNESLRISTEK